MMNYQQTIDYLYNQRPAFERQGASATVSGPVYIAKFANVEADEMRTMFDIVALVDGVETGTPLTWSVEGYVRAARLSSTVSAEELALFNALLIYADSAAAFMAEQ